MENEQTGLDEFGLCGFFHTSANDCLIVYHMTENQDHDQFLSKIEFYELKQYISTLSSLNIEPPFSSLAASKAESSFLYSRIISDGIFRPPIG